MTELYFADREKIPLISEWEARKLAMNENAGEGGEEAEKPAVGPPIRRPYCFRRSRPGPRSLYSSSMRALLRRYLPKQVSRNFNFIQNKVDYFLPIYCIF